MERGLERRLTHAQGWCYDPYGEHEARWFSDGRPTVLVRDGSQESRDPPPAVRPLLRPDPVVGGEGEVLRTHGDRYGWEPAWALAAVRNLFVSTGGD